MASLSEKSAPPPLDNTHLEILSVHPVVFYRRLLAVLSHVVAEGQSAGPPLVQCVQAAFVARDAAGHAL